MSRIRIPFEGTVVILPEVEDALVCLTCGRSWICVRPVGSDYRRACCPACKEHNVELEPDAPNVVRKLH